jgi:hypothetical protein
MSLMMMKTNPITPPRELVRQWIPAGWDCSPNTFTTLLMPIADNAALWSHDHCKSKIKAATDQELEAMMARIEELPFPSGYADALRAACRPKPPTLKEQALEQCNDYIDPDGIIRRALEQLPN